MIAEISSPDSFYFDGTGVLRRVTSSIFDDRGNVAQREASRKERYARFRSRLRSRQADAEARVAALRPKVCDGFASCCMQKSRPTLYASVFLGRLSSDDHPAI